MAKSDSKSVCLKCSSESETIDFGKKIGALSVPGDHIYLYGALGTGKTRIAKGIINAATNTPIDDINSPTFTLMNRYQGHHVVYHADLYRVESYDLEGIGIEMIEESDGILVVEWAEKMNLPSNQVLRIYLEHTDDENVRTITLEWNLDSSWSTRLLGKISSGDLCEALGHEAFEKNYLCDGESLCHS